ncbi:Negative elongation factor A [Lamellibrachia satsuma]|nr:Negative elongation factor A [Lamellibrachia satsuma]
MSGCDTMSYPFRCGKKKAYKWKVELEEILQMAQEDSDQWVAMVGDILKTYPSAGTLNTEGEHRHNFYHEVLADLRKLVRKCHDASMLPMECPYLGRAALMSVAGQQPQPVKHFALQRKPKSAALRAELLQKSSEAALNLKKNNGPTLPIKVRSFAKRMDDTTPLKGIPSKTPLSGGFLRSNSRSSSFAGGTTTGARSSYTGQREGGIKLLDEVPIGAKEAKRRRKMAEQDTVEQEKKDQEATSSTPDYAAGLIAPAAIVPPSGQELSITGPSYVPSNVGVTRLPSATTGGSATLPATAISAATQQARENLQQQLQQQLGQSQIVRTSLPQQILQTGGATALVQTSAAPQTSSAVPQLVVTTVTSQAQSGSQPQKTTVIDGEWRIDLMMHREQIVEAQEMFRTSNKVTRPEKALILGFLAGSRDNPCPQQGDVVNIRLSESSESVQQPDGLFRPMWVDTYFQMNYRSGEWKRIRKFRDYEIE